MDEMMRELPAKPLNLMAGKRRYSRTYPPRREKHGSGRGSGGGLLELSPIEGVVSDRTVADRLTPPGGGQGSDQDETPPVPTVRDGLCGTQVQCMGLLQHQHSRRTPTGNTGRRTPKRRTPRTNPGGMRATGH